MPETSIHVLDKNRGMIVVTAKRRRLHVGSWLTGVTGYCTGVLASEHWRNSATLPVVAKTSVKGWASQWNVIPYPFRALTLLVGQQEGHPAWKKAGCWFVGGDSLTWALHVMQAAVVIAPSIICARMKSRLVTFWYDLTGLSWKMAFKRVSYAVIDNNDCGE